MKSNKKCIVSLYDDRNMCSTPKKKHVERTSIMHLSPLNTTQNVGKYTNHMECLGTEPGRLKVLWPWQISRLLGVWRGAPKGWGVIRVEGGDSCDTNGNWRSKGSIVIGTVEKMQNSHFHTYLLYGNWCLGFAILNSGIPCGRVGSDFFGLFPLK